MDIRDMQFDAHANAVEKGFYDGDLAQRNIGELLMLIVSEAAEALESFRDHGYDAYDQADMLAFVEKCQLEGPETTADTIPDGMAYELADIIIRVGDMAAYLHLDLNKAVEQKMRYNATRPTRHGGKRA